MIIRLEIRRGVVPVVVPLRGDMARDVGSVSRRIVGCIVRVEDRWIEGPAEGITVEDECSVEHLWVAGAVFLYHVEMVV